MEDNMSERGRSGLGIFGLLEEELVDEKGGSHEAGAGGGGGSRGELHLELVCTQHFICETCPNLDNLPNVIFPVLALWRVHVQRHPAASLRAAVRQAAAAHGNADFVFNDLILVLYIEARDANPTLFMNPSNWSSVVVG